MSPFWLASDGHDEPTIWVKIDGRIKPVVRRVDIAADARHLWDELVRRVTS